MDPALVGVLLTVAFSVFVGALAWLRSDVDARFDRLESKLDGLIMALARSGHLAEPQAPAAAAAATPPPSHLRLSEAYVGCRD